MFKIDSKIPWIWIFISPFGFDLPELLRIEVVMDNRPTNQPNGRKPNVVSRVQNRKNGFMISWLSLWISGPFKISLKALLILLWPCCLVHYCNCEYRPAKGKFLLPEYYEKKLNYAIYNSLGKLIINGTLNSPNYNIDISKLESQIYILKIGEFSYKIIKK